VSYQERTRSAAIVLLLARCDRTIDSVTRIGFSTIYQFATPAYRRRERPQLRTYSAPSAILPVENLCDPVARPPEIKCLSP